MSGQLSLFWFRRDLRVQDHPALAAAARRGPVVGVFVADGALLGPAGATRRAYLLAALGSLNRDCGGSLCVRVGDPGEELVSVALETRARALYATRDAGVYGRGRDVSVESRLVAAGIEVHWVDSNYVVAPGTLHTGAGHAYQVFTPFRRAWWAAARLDEARVSDVGWRPASGESLAAVGALGGTRRPWYFGDLPDVAAPISSVGSAAARIRLEEFVRRAEVYASLRNRPDVEGTSRLSADLRFGILHPRQVLRSVPSEAFASEIAWRVLRRRPLASAGDGATWRERPRRATSGRPRRLRPSPLRALGPW